ncbi:cytochrome-c oxidase, cbb3-type subunit III [Altererythrobacter sp.]|uniref:cytochrome-c oxidase, cbb3-type subunit III n=1 Tax=Altererythrobacter sp. TaxID=1872480 RepID=UPI003CFDE539
MANKRVDETTGTDFVGHEWDGIEELDTPMPRWWLFLYYATIVWGIIYVVLYPAWPMVSKATEGYLGWTSRGQLAQEMKAAEEGRAAFRQQLASMPIEEVAGDPALLQQAVAGGRAAFTVNCVQCHGAGAAGGPGYPNLNDDDWLWGGDFQTIEYTIANGIRQPEHDLTRYSLMPTFDGAFDAKQLDAVTDQVLSFSGKAQSSELGAQLYADNCSVCHGPAGEGDRTQGAPALNDAIWLYGGNRELIKQQILNPRMGIMPAWQNRLDPVTIKMLTAYVHSLGGGEDPAEVSGDQDEISGDQTAGSDEQTQ